jgi:hypothetical protein
MSTQLDQAIAEFLARGGKITQCGTSTKQAKSLKQLRREQDARLEADGGFEAEHLAERERELYAEAKAAGFSTSEALDYSRG